MLIVCFFNKERCATEPYVGNMRGMFPNIETNQDAEKLACDLSRNEQTFTWTREWGDMTPITRFYCGEKVGE